METNQKIKIQMNLFTKEKQTFICQKHGYQRGNMVGKDESGAWDEHTHTILNKIDNLQELLYSTGNSAQYSAITYMRKESEIIVDICICITDSFCCTAENNTTL